LLYIIIASSFGRFSTSILPSILLIITLESSLQKTQITDESQKLLLCIEY
jgi:hypothetical protein